MFRRGIGEQSEVVGKEMYEFEDHGGRMLALRPEGTASVVRTYVQHRPNLPWKAWYVTPAFRYERPQAGRYRQHHQLGVEALGPSDPDLDVEVVVLAHDFYRAIGLRQIALRLNSMGDANCRPAYLDTLRTALSAKRDQLCPEHRERLDANPLRVFDCKTPECLAATADGAAPGGRTSATSAASTSLAFGRDSRPPAWATRWTIASCEGSTTTPAPPSSLPRPRSRRAKTRSGAVAATTGSSRRSAGRPPPASDSASASSASCWPATPRAPWSIRPRPPTCGWWTWPVGPRARDLVIELRRAGLFAERAYDGRSMKAQLRQADRASARIAVIVGRKELEEGTATVRPLRGGLAGDGAGDAGGLATGPEDAGQVQVPRADVLDTVRAMIDKS